MKRSISKHPSAMAPLGSLGTFAGVFTPSILTILGIILFLRLGYVVGSAGLGRALLILMLANAISVLTTFSLSAIATNLRVKGGGDYYLISRTLGLEFGGSIGIVLYLAQSVSIAFYCIGFGEVFAKFLDSQAAYLPQIIAAAAVAFLFIFAWLGADWATRFQYVVMTVLGTALISFFIGGLARFDSALLTQNWSAPSSGLKIWVIFAIFFPAVTGFTQGVSMSGDLQNPGKSLPLGTFLAVGLSIIVYFIAAVVLAASVTQKILISDYSAMLRVAAVEFLITAGVIAATLSSAMASFLGAPRILQSLAGDRIFPFLNGFAKGYGPAGNPRRGVLLSTLIAFITIALGNLNLIAPVVSMFFLISYGLLNYATYYEARTESPSFRPRFHWYDRRISLVGFITCLAVMLAIDPLAGIIALIVLFAIYQYLKRTAGPARWADSQRSYHFQQVREHLLAAAAEPEHPRDWRPQLLLFSENPHRRKQLFDFAGWIQRKSGFTTVVRILEGQGLKMMKLRKEAEGELSAEIKAHGLEAFPFVLVESDLNTGIHSLVQAYGIGPVRANTILLNWFEQLPEGDSVDKKLSYGRNLRTAFGLGRNIIVLDAKQDGWNDLKAVPGDQRRIDVWWWGDATSNLMLLLAYLITRNRAWENTRIRVLAACFTAESQKTVADLGKIIEEVRIEAEPEVVIKPNADAIAAYSSDASLVFLPFRFRGDQPCDPFGRRPEGILARLSNVAMVLAAEDVELDAEPEEGKAGEIAAVLDTLSETEKRADNAEKEAAKATEAAETAKEKLQQLEATSSPSEVDNTKASEIKASVKDAERQAEKAQRRSAKARAKAKAAAQEVEDLGGQLPQKEADQDRKE
jgi:amino acid transporter